MPLDPNHANSGGNKRGPGPLSYIAGLSLAAIAGFAAADLWLTPKQPSDQISVQASSDPARDAAPGGAQASESSAGLEKLVVHDSPRAVPDFTFIDADNEERTLADWGGQFLLVNIWATWCAPCKEEMPALSRLQAQLGGDDFVVLPISVDRGGLDKPRAFLEEIDADNLPLLLEQSGRLNVTLDVLGLPATLLIGPDGREIARMIGPAEWDSPAAITRLRQLMAAEG